MYIIMISWYQPYYKIKYRFIIIDISIIIYDLDNDGHLNSNIKYSFIQIYYISPIF